MDEVQRSVVTATGVLSLEYSPLVLGHRRSRDNKLGVHAFFSALVQLVCRSAGSWSLFLRGSLVELRGLEPLTLSLRTRCATSCATAPYVAFTGTGPGPEPRPGDAKRKASTADRSRPNRLKALAMVRSRRPRRSPRPCARRGVAHGPRPQPHGPVRSRPRCDRMSIRPSSPGRSCAPTAVPVASRRTSEA